MLVKPITVDNLATDASRSNTHVVLDAWLHASGGLLLISDEEDGAPPCITIDGDAVLKIVQRVKGGTRALGYSDLEFRSPIRIYGYVMRTGIAAIPYRFSHVNRLVLVQPDGRTAVHTINESLYDLYVTIPGALTDVQRKFLSEHLSQNMLEDRLRQPPGDGRCFLRAAPESAIMLKLREFEDAGFKVSVKPTPFVFGKPLMTDPAAYLHIV